MQEENIYDLPNVLDQSYLEEYEKFNKDVEINKIKIFSLYITDNVVNNIETSNILLEDNILSKEKLLYIIKKNQIYNELKFKLVNILKYDLNITVNQFKNLNNCKDTSSKYIESLKILDNIKFNSELDIIKNFNCIFLIYNINNKHNSSNTTKRIFFNVQKKTKKKTT